MPWDTIAIVTGLGLVVIVQMVIYLLGFEKLQLRLHPALQFVTSAILATIGVGAFGFLVSYVSNNPPYHDAFVDIALLVGSSAVIIFSVFFVFLIALRVLRRTKKSQKYLFVHAGITACIVSVGLLLSLPVLFIFAFIPDQIYEDLSSRRFHEEIKNTNGVTVTEFIAWDGSAWGSLLVDGKGPVSFSYSPSGPSFGSIDGLKSSYWCYYLGDNGRPVEFSHSVALGRSPELTKWLPYQPRSFQDVVDHYDELVEALEKLPMNPELEEVDVRHVGRLVKENVVKKPTDEYRLYGSKNGRKTACDLYTMGHVLSQVKKEAANVVVSFANTSNRSQSVQASLSINDWTVKNYFPNTPCIANCITNPPANTGYYYIPDKELHIEVQIGEIKDALDAKNPGKIWIVAFYNQEKNQVDLTSSDKQIIYDNEK